MQLECIESTSCHQTKLSTFSSKASNISSHLPCTMGHHRRVPPYAPDGPTYEPSETHPIIAADPVRLTISSHLHTPPAHHPYYLSSVQLHNLPPAHLFTSPPSLHPISHQNVLHKPEPNLPRCHGIAHRQARRAAHDNAQKATSVPVETRVGVLARTVTPPSPARRSGLIRTAPATTPPQPNGPSNSRKSRTSRLFNPSGRSSTTRPSPRSRSAIRCTCSRKT